MKEQILLGTLLGDATVAKSGKTKRIAWEHSMAQKEYAIWKGESSLKNYSIYERSRLDSRTNNTYHSITVYSTTDNYEVYRNLFYSNGKKEVSNLILELLTPLAIAVWFMDDGNLYYNGNNCHLTLSVNGFNEQSVDRIINYFSSKYGILFKKKGRALRITSVEQVKLFESIFAPWYHHSMEYKTLQFNKQKYNNGKRSKK